MNLAPLQSIEVRIEASATTTAPSVFASTNVIPANRQPLAFAYNSQRTNLTGTTSVTVISAPISGTQAVVQEIVLSNNDSVDHTFIIQLNDNGTRLILWSVLVPAGQTLRYGGTNGLSLGLGSAGGGTVTSVGLGAPSIFTVTGSPVTGSGTLTLSLATQAINRVFAGPTSGSAAAPTFRSLVNADIAGLNATTASAWSTARTLAFTGDATGTNSVDGSANVSTALTLATVNANVGTFGDSTHVPAFTVNAKGLITGVTNISIGGGTVTSVALALPASVFTVSGSPVTSTGTLTGALATQTANTVWAGPTTGASAAPTFRALVAADVPSLGATYLQVANNLSDVVSATTSRTNLGLGTMATQNASAVAITGGVAYLTTQSFVDPGLSAGALPATTGVIIVANGNGLAAKFEAYAFTNSPVQTSNLNYFRSRGVRATPLALNSGDAIGTASYIGYNSTGFAVGAKIDCLTTEVWTTSANGCKYLFSASKPLTASVVAVMGVDPSTGVVPGSNNSFSCGISTLKWKDVWSAGPVVIGEYTVATLPSAATYKGGHANISDGAAVPVPYAVVAGGGTVYLPVYSDGTNWRNA